MLSIMRTCKHEDNTEYLAFVKAEDKKLVTKKDEDNAITDVGIKKVNEWDISPG